VDVGAFLAGLAEDARAWAQRHEIELGVAIAALSGKARVDAEALRRAVDNLLDNARKHSGVRAMTLEGALVDGSLALAVEDHGRGVPPGLRASVFEPFARAEGENGATGAGLGLAIVREIAREHGGEVTLATPAGGKGARFEIRIPLERGTVEEPKA